MFKRTVTGLVATVALVLGLLVGAPMAIADTHVAAVTLTYDDSQAPEYADAIAAGLQVWNDSVENVQVEKVAPGEQADVQFISDPGWPRATLGPFFPGDSGATVWFGKQAVDEGYDVIRIAALEFGHILGLPDVKPGPCSSLMSGSTAGVECTNPIPNAEEIAGVESNYAGGFAKVKPSGKVLVEVG
jgi:snapalysin